MAVKWQDLPLEQIARIFQWSAVYKSVDITYAKQKYIRNAYMQMEWNQYFH